jgi:outer membrane biosynthesis protein TonB
LATIRHNKTRVLWHRCASTATAFADGLTRGLCRDVRPISVLEYGLRHRMKRLLALLLSVMSSAAVAQTTGTVNPSPAPAQPSVKQDVPPGGCMPIGLTASGEIVFPIQCKELIEQHRGKDVEQKPAAEEQKPAVVEEKPAAKQSEAVPPQISQPANKPVETVALQKRVEQTPRDHATGPGGCQHFRSFDPASATYLGFDGQRRPCR